MEIAWMLTWQETASAAGLGLAGGLHCAAMCGPLAAAYSLHAKRELLRGFLLDGSYHAGRALGYTSLGAVFGLVGAGLTVVGLHSGVPTLAGVIGGLLMILVAGAQLGWGRQPRWQALTASVHKLSAAVLRRGGLQATFILGALSCLFPCGLLFAAYARAAATGNPVNGALFMLVFSLCTAPSLVIIARLSALLSLRRSRFQTIASWFIIVMGLALIANAVVLALKPAPEEVDCSFCLENTER